ncbi:SRPBCC family protein [Seohaeicola saemankumensis]|nr:SRPBCC family protein [Seohaeicola saemankumensis]MCA0871722.1 SRPBCC family protein [Seohaeicola saemankumensis]
MQFSSKEDIEAPIADVFAMLAEFEAYERSALRRGIEVQRVNEHAPQATGLAWDAAFTMRGKHRKVHVVLTAYDPPNAMRFETDSQGLDGLLTVDLLALSPRRTRMAVVMNLTPKTLSARLFVQSLKLAKSNLTKRFKVKVADYAKAMEERFTSTA